MSFAVGEYYHVYNRGVDKRIIFEDDYDMRRFYEGLLEFNVPEPIGSLYELSFAKKLGSLASKPGEEKLVSIVAHCASPNHFHLLLRQEAENGIEKLMHRVGTGYTKYFNNKYKRSGSLFQGVYKAIHVDSNEYILHLSAYINLNDCVHQLGSSASKLVRSRSSWVEYTGKDNRGICKKDIILDQFEDIDDYKKFALSSLDSIKERKDDMRDIGDFLLE